MAPGKGTRRGYSLVEMMIVLVILGSMAAIGAGIGGSTMTLFRLRASAERLMQDIRAAREAALARGPLPVAGAGGTGIYFFRGVVVDNATGVDAARGWSYVPIGINMRREVVPRPTTPSPAKGTGYYHAVVNLPDGATLAIGGPGAGAAPVTGNPAGVALVFSNAGSVGSLDGASEAAATTIDLTDDAVGTYRITITGPAGNRSNPVLEYLGL